MREVAKLLRVEIELQDLHERMSELEEELHKVLDSITDKEPSGAAASMYV